MSSQRLFKLLPVVIALVTPQVFAQAAIADESAAIAAAANAFMASGKPVNISADKLKELMANPATAPVLVSVCAPNDYAKASVPGSINIPRGAFWKPPMLAKLPKDKPIVTYCYTGTGAVGPATVLNLMGYNAVQLEWGMMGWSKNDAGLGPATRFPESQQNYPIVKGPQGTAVTYARPVVATGKTTLEQVLVERADAVESADRTVSMTAEAVQELLADNMPGNDPFILDVRAPADFVKGHIQGAINVPAVGVYQAGHLAKLPTGRRIVVADYNGQAAVGISYVLATLGYNARGLQMGMMGWSTDDAVMGPYKRFPADQRDYPIANK
ncbi:MAG: rhodanese-like domain-containing protein [Rubrivivax sp.]|nr:rhodanese-like domain-containing protein [Rubrivivax sp.]